MTIEDKIKAQKLQYDINREAAKILALKSLKYYIIQYTFFPKIRFVNDSIFSGKVTLGEADKQQSFPKENILEFNNRARPRSKVDIKKNVILLKV